MENLIDLDECVVNALELFTKEKLPKIDLKKFKRPLVVGSGNAAVTGKILFEGTDAVFADEGNYKQKLKSAKLDGAVLISASGGKHAPIIAKDLKKKKVKTILLTNNKDALAKEFVNKSYILPKNPEPYTYNTSTYLSMVISKTKEDARKILSFIKKMEIPRNLSKYDSFYFIIPERFENSREMFLTKFDELFGSKISGRVFTLEQTKHAKTIVPSDKELFVGFGIDNKVYGKKRLNFALPKNIGYVGFIAAVYYFIGRIQKQNKPYFKQNIEKYVKFVSKIFNQKINVIVE